MTQTMITTVSLLDLMNDYLGWSDYQIAKALGTRTGAVSRWRNQKGIMSDEYGVKVAKILGFPEEWLLLQLHAERNFNKPFGQKLVDLAENEPLPKEAANILNIDSHRQRQKIKRPSSSAKNLTTR